MAGERLSSYFAPTRERFTNFRNTRFETPGQKKKVYWASYIPSEVAAILSRVEIHGELPNEGPGIVLAPHVSWRDMFIFQWLTVVHARRTMRTFAKKPLVDPDAVDSDFAQGRRRQKHNPKGMVERFIESNAAKKVKRYVLQVRSAYVSSFDPIPVEIGKITRANVMAVREASEELQQGHLIGVFPQGTRKPPYDLLDMLPAMVRLLKYNPDVPIYIVGFSGTDKSFFHKIVINIGKVATYRELEQVYGENEQAIIDAIADAMAAQIDDPALKTAWWLNRNLGLSREEIDGLRKGEAVSKSYKRDNGE